MLGDIDATLLTPLTESFEITTDPRDNKVPLKLFLAVEVERLTNRKSWQKGSQSKVGGYEA